MWEEYVHGKQTYAQLGDKYGLSLRTIKGRLDQVVVEFPTVTPRDMVIIADTTFFGNDFGVTVLRDWYEKENVFVKFVERETMKTYREGFEFLKKRGCDVLGLVSDGKRGLLGAFPNIPTQMCHFHQKQIIRRYITMNPRLEAGKDLKAIVDRLTLIDPYAFETLVETWHECWGSFLKERTENPETGKWVYTHGRLRSAYSSLKRNMKYLFTYQKYPKLNIPNTTNSLDGTFSKLKKLVNVHQGLSQERKIKLIKEVLRR